MKWKEFFTKVFLINLPEMTERKRISEDALIAYGIEFEVIEAIKNDNGVIGLLHTMKKLFEKILASDIQDFIVLEDDFKFLLPPNGMLNELIDQIPSDYHLIYLGCTLLSPVERISENLLKIGSSYSTHAIGYSRRAVEYILPLMDQVLAYDIKLMKSIQTEGKCYCTFPRMVTQITGYSSIEGKETDWETHMALTYLMNTKNI